jgi:putative endonuclease
MTRRSTGLLGEKLAREFLQKRGFSILQANYRRREGEIDIIARDEDMVAFVEVRTKRSLEFGSPEESITPGKMEKLRTLAARYCQEHPELPPSWRIDVVAVDLDKSNKPVRIELIENAVGEA